MRRVAVVSAILLLLAGCQSSSSDKPTATGSTTSATPSGTSGASGTPGPSGPDCKDVWQDGATLPRDYTTCVQDGAIGAQDVTKCKDGTKLVAYSDAYYAITGGTISMPNRAPMQDTREFGRVFARCTGE